MSASQRRKGAQAERELCSVLQDHLGVRMVRNLEQSRSGGHDLQPDPAHGGPVAAQLARFAIESKRYARSTPGLIAGWWQQACEQAERAGLVPLLAYRVDRAEWRVVLPLCELVPSLEPWPGIAWTADLSLPGFASVIRERAAAAS